MAFYGGERNRARPERRPHDKFGYAIDLKLAREKAQRIVSLMDAHLAKSQWLALDRPTIADVACMPYVAVSHEGGVPLTPYPAVRAWVERVKALPGFMPMPGQEQQ